MASDSPSQYLYLSEDDLEEYKSDPKQLKILNEFRENDLRKKLAHFSLSENTFKYKTPTHSTANNDLRLVIIGKTGQGKSATANTILGKVRFKEDFTAVSVTKESRCFDELVDGRKISVMDTPGLQDTHQSNENILKELSRMTKLFPGGVHAFVYVMNMANPRFTAEDKNVLDLIQKTFGGGFKDYCLLVFSHGDSELKLVDLDTYKNRQMAIGKATSGDPTPQYASKDKGEEDQEQEGLASLLNELSWKMLAIDNKTIVTFEKAYYREQIIAMVDRMRTLNNPEIYTNDMFVKAQQRKEAMRKKGLRKGWDPSIMNKVETILAANPSISREQLQSEINRELQEETLIKIMTLQRKEEEFETRRIAEEKRMQEQKRVDEKKRQTEEKERRERREKEDQEKEERYQKEESERQERREREDRDWQSRLKQQEIERQSRYQREEIERQRWLDKEREEREQQMKFQRDEWENRKREEEEKYEMRQQHQKEMWEKQFREDQQRRQEQEEDRLRRREEEESRRIMQIKREEAERRERIRQEEIELEKKISQSRKEDLERQMRNKEEEQKQLERQERVREEFELRQTQERQKELRLREESERRRQEQLEKEESDRLTKRKQEDNEREERMKREQEEREKANMKIKQENNKELEFLRKEIKKMKGLLEEKDLKVQVAEIKDEHENIFAQTYNGMVAYTKEWKEWCIDVYHSKVGRGGIKLISEVCTTCIIQQINQKLRSNSR